MARPRSIPSALLTIAALLAMLWPAIPASALPASGGFVVPCNYSHSAMDDPIVDPGMAGMSHSHEFFGNTSAGATSTYQSMVVSPTTCVLRDDTAGYWVPTPRLDGHPFHPHGRVGDIRIYYKAAGASAVEPVPANLEVIGGNKMAMDAGEEEHVTWYCGASPEGTTPRSRHPYDCTPYAKRFGFVDGLVGIVLLPRCWNGAGLQPSDMAYPMEGTSAQCPLGFPHLLPQISERIHFGILDPCAGLRPCRPGGDDRNVRLSFSSGPYYTFHADFWNTWRPGALETLVARCIDAHVHCGFQKTKYTLAVFAVGGGVVRSASSGIDCDAACTRDLGAGTVVRLIARAPKGAAFIGWAGACTGSDRTCTVRMDGARSVTAVFAGHTR